MCKHFLTLSPVTKKKLLNWKGLTKAIRWIQEINRRIKRELAIRDQKINEINQILAAKEKELGIKTQQIAELNQNVSNLQEESTSQKETISNQDKSLNTIHYLLGSRKGLKEANVISRQGIFCPPIVSSQAQNAKFVDADMRELTSIPLNTKKAKILPFTQANHTHWKPGMTVCRLWRLATRVHSGNKQSTW